MIESIEVYGRESTLSYYACGTTKISEWRDGERLIGYTIEFSETHTLHYPLSAIRSVAIRTK